MTVTQIKINEALKTDNINQVKDITNQLIKKHIQKLNKQGLSEKQKIYLLIKYFKVMHKNGKDLVINSFSGGSCISVHRDYIQAHDIKDRGVGSNIHNHLILVAGYAYFPGFGPYVKESGHIFYNTWRESQTVLKNSKLISKYKDAWELYFADIDLWLATEGKEGGEVGVYQTLKPKLWLVFEKLWFPNKPKEAKVFTDWLSVVLTFPAERVRWAPVIRSEQGIGKGTLIQEVIRPILGSNSVKELDYSLMTGKFSGDQLLSRLVVLNEVKADTASQYNKLKSLITDDYTYVERKNEQAFQTKVFFSTLMFSNYHRPLNIPEGDRRYWVPEYITHPKHFGNTPKERQDKTDQFLAVWRTEIRNGGLEELATFFKLNTLIMNKLPNNAPTTNAKEEIISRRTEDAKDKLALYINNNLKIDEGFKIGDLQKRFSPALSDHDVMSVAKELGYISTRKTIEGTLMRVWSLQGKEVSSLHQPTFNL